MSASVSVGTLENSMLRSNASLSIMLRNRKASRSLTIRSS